MVDYETSTPRLPRISIDYDTPDSEYTYTGTPYSYCGANQAAYSTGLGQSRYPVAEEHLFLLDGTNKSKLPKSPLVSFDSSSLSADNRKHISRQTNGKRPDRLASTHSTFCTRNRLSSDSSETNSNSVFTVPSRYSDSSQKPFSKSARSSDRKLSFNMAPMSQSAKSTRTDASSTVISDGMSPYRLDLVDCEPNTSHPSREPTPESSRVVWKAPRITRSQYNGLKDKLLQEGKFKERLIKYFRHETKWWEEKSDSEDDGYDTDLDEQLGLDLIADEKTREILEDGAFPEYKHDCRKFRSNPNSYFLRHCLDDDFRMRHRYLSKGDSITISKQIKNHLTMNSIDLADNGVGPRGMKYFKNMLHTNKHLTELNLSGNKLGPLGAKYLRSSLISNCFLQKLDISDNNFGEQGGKYIAAVVEDNVNLKDLNISKNAIGDAGADLIATGLGRNISLKILDISGNHISPKGAVKIAESMKKNTELEVLIAAMNGFGEEGGKALITALRQNTEMRVLDLTDNRITDPVIKLLISSLNVLGLTDVRVGFNPISTKIAIDLLTGVMAMTSPISFVDFEGLHVTDELKGLANALHIVYNIDVNYSDPPSKRETTADALTRNLATLCDFMEDEEIEVDDLFPDYEDLEGTREGQAMITVKEVLCALEMSGKITRKEKLRKLAAKMVNGKQRKFQIGELALVYDQVICGKDPLREMPLRTHLRRSIADERAEKERKEQKKAKKYSSVPPPPKKSKGKNK